MHFQQINLLEAMTLGDKDHFALQTHWIAWALAGLILLTGLGVYKKGSEITVLHNDIAGLQRKKVFLTEEMGAAEAAMKDVVQILALTLSKRIHWSNLMREVSLLIPEGVWITRWESFLPQLEKGKPAPQGKPKLQEGQPQVKFAGEALSQERLTRFLSGLENSPLILNTRLVHARQIKDEVHFEMVVTLKTEQAS